MPKKIPVKPKVARNTKATVKQLEAARKNALLATTKTPKRKTNTNNPVSGRKRPNPRYPTEQHAVDAANAVLTAEPPHTEGLVEALHGEALTGPMIQSTEVVKGALPAELAYPVYHASGAFFFRDSTWLNAIGPFGSRQEAVTSSRAYEQSLRADLSANPSHDKYDPRADPSAGSVGPDTMKEAYADTSVKHPSHYNAHPTGIECIEVNQHFNSNLGAAIKYIWRAGLKAPGVEGKVRDLQKAREYIDFEIDRIRRFEGE